MSLSINVGLSRKASRDYQSTGVSINVTAELDQSLLAKPDELQQQVGNLYAQAEAALDRQAQSMGEPEAPQRHDQNAGQRRNNGNGYANGGRRGNSNGNASPATQSQRRAIDAIARRVGVDPALEAQDIIGVPLDDLSLRQASELIDHLKDIEPAGNGRNGNNRR